MNVELLRSCVGDRVACQYLTCYRINANVAIDAGSLGFHGASGEQEAIRHVFLTHSHIDHIAGLPALLENTYGFTGEPVTVYGLAHTLDSLRRDVFNNRLYPDLSSLKPAFGWFREVKVGETIEVEGLRFTPFPLEHPVPTVGYRIESDAGAVLIVTDTRVSPLIGEAVAATRRLLGVYLECAFPNEFDTLAHISGHLTSEQFLAEARRVPPGVPVLAVHVKGRYFDRVEAELRAGGLPDVALCEPGRVYRFGGE